ncbi:acyltransferase-domain-containing protein [Entophlyctis helioformis]|nr:acyltransferase-domain-containing protein [Entophlyctis helioformis]
MADQTPRGWCTEPHTHAPGMAENKSILFYLRMVAFLGILFGCSLAINYIQFIGLPLKLVSRSYYRRWMRFTQRLFGSLMLIETYLFAPLDIVLTGDHEALRDTDVTVIMANHQIYSDWWYIWLMAWFKGAHGELKIMLKHDLSKVPILGWGMQFFEFLFLERKWLKDRKTLTQNLLRAKTDNMPLWLLMFPEGTVITDDTQGKSRAFAKKNDISDDPKYVLIPKSTGLYNSLRILQPEAEYIYDFTIGYSGINAGQCPFDEYPLSRVFYEGNGPQQIHIHVDRFRTATLPGMTKPYKLATDADNSDPLRVSNGNGHSVGTPANDNDEEFTLWLRKRFLEKDQLMADFYDKREFPVVSRDGTGGQQVLTISPHVQDWITITGLLLGSIISSLYVLL